MSKWEVELSGKAKKNLGKLPKKIQITFFRLLHELRDNPTAHNWPNYQKLGKHTRHCHLQRGKPTYVACWAVIKDKNYIEVYYVGTHEKAPY